MKRIQELWAAGRPVLLYILFGGLTTVVNIAVYMVSSEVFRIANVPANIIAWIWSVVFAYLTNKIWVFRSGKFSPSVLFPEIWKFVSCRLGTGVLDLAVMFVGVDLMHGPPVLFKVCSNIIVIILNYVLSALFVFGKKD